MNADPAAKLRRVNQPAHSYATYPLDPSYASAEVRAAAALDRRRWLCHLASVGASRAGPRRRAGRRNSGPAVVLSRALRSEPLPAICIRGPPQACAACIRRLARVELHARDHDPLQRHRARPPELVAHFSAHHARPAYPDAAWPARDFHACRPAADGLLACELLA